MAVISRIDHPFQRNSKFSFIAGLYEDGMQPQPNNRTDKELLEWFQREYGKYHTLPEHVYVAELFFPCSPIMCKCGGKPYMTGYCHKWYYFYKLKEEQNER